MLPRSVLLQGWNEQCLMWKVIFAHRGFSPAPNAAQARPSSSSSSFSARQINSAPSHSDAPKLRTLASWQRSVCSWMSLTQREETCRALDWTRGCGTDASETQLFPQEKVLLLFSWNSADVKIRYSNSITCSFTFGIFWVNEIENNPHEN